VWELLWRERHEERGRREEQSIRRRGRADAEPVRKALQDERIRQSSQASKREDETNLPRGQIQLAHA
jgi:hypothetical protein